MREGANTGRPAPIRALFRTPTRSPSTGVQGRARAAILSTPTNQPLGGHSATPEKVFGFTTTHNAYGFLERLQKHEGRAATQRIAVLDGQWVDLQLADDLMLTADQIRTTVEHLRSLVSEGVVTIEASALWFPTGGQLLDYVHEIAAELPRNEVEP